MKPPRGRPDHEAEGFKVEAEEISKPKKFYRNSKHNGQRIEAKGNVKVTITKEHPEGATDDDFRPKAGTVLVGGERQNVTIESKLIIPGSRRNNKDTASVRRDGRIFGKLRRRRRWPPTGGE